MSKTTKKLKEIWEYRETRKVLEDSDFMITITSNLLTNLSNRSNFIHKELISYKEKDRNVDVNLQLLTGLYVCSLVTCWETFFRDLVIFICNHDKDIHDRIVSEHVGDIPLGLTIGEFYVRKYNFQNLEQIRQAFDVFDQEGTG